MRAGLEQGQPQEHWAPEASHVGKVLVIQSPECINKCTAAVGAFLPAPPLSSFP